MSVVFDPYRSILLTNAIDTARRRTKQAKSDTDILTGR
jgi:hypothetical protein